MSKKKLILITGATGFVGQKLVEKINNFFDTKRIICFTWNKYNFGKNRLLEKRGLDLLRKKNLRLISGDLVTSEGLRDIPRNIGLVINIAANTDTADRDHRCNDVGVRNLLNSIDLRKKGFHFVQISTIAFMSGRKDYSRGIRTSDTPVPTNEYGRSKLRGEKILIKAASENNFKLTIVRLNTVYGSGSRPDSMFELLGKWTASNSIITRINWPGLTSLVNVEDVAQIVLRLSKKVYYGRSPTIYTLYAESLPFYEICRIFYRNLNQKYNPINLPRWMWSIASGVNRFIPFFEIVLPKSLFNQIWRFGLIVSDVVYCDTPEIRKLFPDWKPLRLSNIPPNSFF